MSLEAQHQQHRGRLLLTGVTVVDVRTGRLHADRAVIVEGTRITAVGASDRVRPRQDDEVVQARGSYLIPGLWDMHVHSAAAAAREFPVYLALGITGIRNMHSTVDTALDLVVGLKRRLRDGELLGPRLVANGPVLDGPFPVHPGSVRAGTAEQGRRAVDSLVAGGADFIKVYIRLPRDAYFAAAHQARRLRVPFVGHVPVGVGIDEAVEAGQRSFEHTNVLDWSCSTRGDSVLRAFLADSAPTRDSYYRARTTLMATWDAAACAPAVAALRGGGAWVVPTLVVTWASVAIDTLLADSGAVAIVPQATLDGWRAAVAEMPAEMRAADASEVRNGMKLVRLLDRAGVPLLAGTDVGNYFTVPGYSLHTELELLVRAGVSPLAALQAATLNPARFLDGTDSMGTVAKGQLADLVLLDDNPLEDIRHTRRIRAVVANGRYLHRRALDSILTAAKRAARTAGGQ